jgi:hypothetical protein
MQRAKEVVVDIITGLLPGAEKELAAYVGAVQELLGSEQAGQSIEDWMEELQSTDWANPAAIADWRAITMAAAVRLASRVNVRHDRRARMSV